MGSGGFEKNPKKPSNLFGFDKMIFHNTHIVKVLLLVRRHQVYALHNRIPTYDNQITIPRELWGNFFQVNMEPIKYPKNIDEFGRKFGVFIDEEKNVTIVFDYNDSIVMSFDEMIELSRWYNEIPAEQNYTLHCLNSMGEEFTEPAFNNSRYIRTIIVCRVLCNLIETFKNKKLLTFHKENTDTLSKLFDYRLDPKLVCYYLDTQNWDHVIRSNKDCFDQINQNRNPPTRKLHSEVESVVEQVAPKPSDEIGNLSLNLYGKWTLFQDIFLPSSQKEYTEFFQGERLPKPEDFESKDFRDRWFNKCLSFISSKYPNRVTDKFREKAKKDFNLNWEWIILNRPNIFVENSNLCEFLLESSCNVEVEKIFVEKSGFIYSFSLPSDYKFEGIEIPPFLVKCEKDETQSTIEMTILFRTGFFMGLSETSTVSYDELVEDYANYTWRTYMGISKITDDHLKFLVSVAKKFTIMTLLYKQTHPEKFVDGYPSIDDTIMTSHVELKSKTLSLDKKYLVKQTKAEKGTEPTTVAPHWRRAHFATLRHENFRRNPDGSVRIILRKGSNINFDRMKPKTLKA